MLNIIAIMGRLVADPELRHTPQGTAVTSFTVAVDRSFCGKGEQRQADFIDVVAWRGTAEFVCKYFQKGSMIAVDGSLQTRTYKDKTGANRKACEIVANNVNFTGSKARGNTEPTVDAEPARASNYGDFQFIDDDEDLPF